MLTENDDIGLLGRVVLLAALLWIGGVVYALMRVDTWTTLAGFVLGILLVAYANVAYQTSALEAVYGSTDGTSHVEPLARGTALSIIFFGPPTRWIIESGLAFQADDATIVKAALAVSAVLGLGVGGFFWVARGVAHDRRAGIRRDTA